MYTGETGLPILCYSPETQLTLSAAPIRKSNPNPIHPTIHRKTYDLKDTESGIENVIIIYS